MFKFKKRKNNYTKDELANGAGYKIAKPKSIEELKKYDDAIAKDIKGTTLNDHSSYFNVHDRNFNKIMLSKMYVDHKYISLQLFLLQSDIHRFEYMIIEKNVVDLIKFMQNNLRNDISISFANSFYISPMIDKKFKINDDEFSYITATTEKPNNISLSFVRDVEIKLSGVKEFAAYDFVIKNFENVVLNLLANGYRVLMGNMFINKELGEYYTVISNRFFTRSQIEHDETKTFELTAELTKEIKLRNEKESNEIMKKLGSFDDEFFEDDEVEVNEELNESIDKIKHKPDIDSSDDSVYKTQVIVLNEDNESVEESLVQSQKELKTYASEENSKSEDNSNETVSPEDNQEDFSEFVTTLFELEGSDVKEDEQDEKPSKKNTKVDKSSKEAKKK